MGKSTYGMGSVVLRGKKWYGYPRIQRKNPITGAIVYDRRPIILGQKASMSKREARETLYREIIQRKGGGQAKGQMLYDGSVTLGWFVRNRYFPLKEGRWSEETAKNKKSLIQTNLLDELGEIPLQNLDRYTLQRHVDKWGETCAKDTVLQMRAYLRDIFEEAVAQDFLYKNRAAKLELPTRLRAKDETRLSWDQLRMALEILDDRDRILVELDMTDALRPSELFALRWRCFEPEKSRLVILETVYKGKIRPWGKTKKSLEPVPLPPLLVSDLQAWKTRCPDASPQAFIFANEEGGFIDTANFRKRVLKQLAATLDLPNLTFQIIRRTIATLSQEKGHVKATQGLMRHARTATTTDVYQKVIPEAVADMAGAIHDELRKPSTAEARTSAIRSKSRFRKQNRRAKSNPKLTPIDTKEGS
jgi:integrase